MPPGAPRPAPRPVSPGARAAILALNNAHATELSLLDAGRLATLLDRAWHARVAGGTEEMPNAFLLAFDQASEYDSPNFLWFRRRYARFAYVDRVVVAPAARGQGLGRSLYAELVARAEAEGYGRVVCEVNLDPPNPVSDAFHAALGFAEVGREAVAGWKVVRYLALPVGAQA